MNFKQKLQTAFPAGNGAGAFLLSVLFWGVAFGCMQGTINNFLSDIHRFSELERGWLEFFREMPGLLLVFILALLHKVGDWKILRMGTLISMVGVTALVIPADKHAIVFLIMLWSTGEHLIMPIRRSLAMRLASSEHGGSGLGLVSGIMNVGTVAGSILVALVFYIALQCFEGISKVAVYNFIWILIALLAGASFCCICKKKLQDPPSSRPRLFFHRKYSVFYALELFYGARKQIFLTFAPFVLIKIYGFDTARVAMLFGIAAAINIFAAPAMGKLTDKIGYRNIMIYDTIVLFFVCLCYGFAKELFPVAVAVWVVGVNFLLDAVLSTTSLATNLYVRDISANRDEVTSTLSTGISINHLISICSAPLGGWIWLKFGVGVLFSFSAVMALANSLCALAVHRPKKN